MAPKRMFIDVLNQMLPHRHCVNDTLQTWLLEQQRSLRRLVRGAKERGFQTVCVANARDKRTTARHTWVDRRERELHAGRRSSLYLSDALLYELIVAEGVPLIYDKRHTTVDILASAALADSESIIVSGQYYKLLKFQNGALKDRVKVWDVAAHRMRKPPLSGTAPRANLTPIGKCAPFAPAYAGDAASYADDAGDALGGALRGGDGVAEFVRGAAYPLAERRGSGSMHLAARPHRAALYAAPVREVFPVWEEKGVQWIDDLVLPDRGATAETDAKRIAEQLLADVGGPHDAVHAATALVYGCELVSYANKTSLLTEVYRAVGAVPKRLLDSNAQLRRPLAARDAPPQPLQHPALRRAKRGDAALRPADAPHRAGSQDAATQRRIPAPDADADEAMFGTRSRLERASFVKGDVEAPAATPEPAATLEPAAAAQAAAASLWTWLRGAFAGKRS
ncbi:hypothetical protein M885DRAFT_614000 [Pelagophyceae sp. CCMP2097]|nr:hypothetical protein M885DRAFT_614000 [Pelagophyceae sp. CCMP2097]